MAVLPFIALGLACIAGLLLFAGAFWDVATMTIPNWVSAAVAGLFPLAAFAAGAPWQAIAFNLGFGAAVLIGCIFLFSANILGGGDAKLIPATSVWTGAAGFGPFALIMALVGGALALTLLVLRRFMQPGARWPGFLNRLLDRTRGAPYAVAIAAGGIFALLHSPLAHPAALTLP